MPADFLDASRLASSATNRAVLATARPILASLLGLSALQDLYRRLPAAAPEMFADLALHALRITIVNDGSEGSRIPARGPVIVAANHPHGALDGLALLSIVRRARPDVRLLANHWLAAIPELASLCFFVDPFGGRTAAERSRTGLRQAHLWLRQGGALIVFPAGEVAHDQAGHETPTEAPWQSTMARLARGTGAVVVPGHITGRNRPLFYWAGRLHAWLRTCLLPRELLRKQGTPVRVRLGVPLHPALFDSETSLTQAAARASRELGERVDEDGAIAAEVAALPPAACLARAGDLQVFVAGAAQIPVTLGEIGRLRERTFRAVGEGTGHAVDLDDFDRSYLHLFAWDARTRCIVGAYRLGLVDRLVARRGPTALYTRTLFRYDQTLLDRLGPAIELGRSFVRLEYQRHHSALLILWRGIGQFVVRHPRYRRLFGPVSISASYQDASQQLLLSFLEQQHMDRELSPLVAAMAPPPRAPAGNSAGAAGGTLDEVNRLVSAWEPDRKGVPVLLRHYLKLGGRVLAFNVDAAFAHALDTLMVLDLPAVERSLLARYFGDQEAARYLAHHARATGVGRAA